MLSSPGLMEPPVDNDQPTHIALPALPKSLSDPALQLLGDGIPHGTRRAYSRDRGDWAFYTELEGVDALPVDEGLLVEYVATLLTTGNPRLGEAARPLSAAGVERRLSAITTWSREQGHGAPDLRAARLMLRGHRRRATTRPLQAAPLTVGALRTLVAEAANCPTGRTPPGRFATGPYSAWMHR